MADDSYSDVFQAWASGDKTALIQSIATHALDLLGGSLAAAGRVDKAQWDKASGWLVAGCMGLYGSIKPEDPEVLIKRVEALPGVIEVIRGPKPGPAKIGKQAKGG